MSQTYPLPPEVVITGEKLVDSYKTPDLVITGSTNFKTSCEALAKYNDEQRSCFKRCEVIGFKLGSSSKGQFPRRKRRLLKPNSYFGDFLVNMCIPRIHFSCEEKLAYECLMFYFVSVHHSKWVCLHIYLFLINQVLSLHWTVIIL